MASREQARKAADTLISDARRRDAQQRIGRLHFFYGSVLSRSEIAELGADTGILRAAFSYAHRQWRLRLAMLSFLLLVLAFAVLEGEWNLLLLALLLAAALALRSLTRALVLEYLQGQAGTETTRPPPS